MTREQKLKKKYGMRPIGATPIDFPQEIGYRCPKGHSNIDWSEFKEHLWCYVCKKDYHYANDCILVKDKHNPQNLPQQPKVIDNITNWGEDGNSFNDIPKKYLEFAA